MEGRGLGSALERVVSDFEVTLKGTPIRKEEKKCCQLQNKLRKKRSSHLKGISSLRNSVSAY